MHIILCDCWDLYQIIVTFIYQISPIFNCRSVLCDTMTQTLQKIVPLGEGGINMEEIVLTHNGISYTKEDIIEMLDLVMEIVGEEV